MENIVVLGAGPAGLSAAYFLSELGYNVTLIEKEDRIGGLGATVKIKDYLLDFGPHSYHMKKTIISELFKAMVGNEVHILKRKARLIMDGKNLRFPVDVKEVLFRVNPFLSLRVVSSFLYSRLFYRGIDPNASFEDSGIKNFGRVLYKIAFGDYSEKVWGLSGKELSAKLAKQKLLTLDLRKLILSALGMMKDETDQLGLNVDMVYDAYPKMGMCFFWDRIAEKIKLNKGKILLSANVDKFIINENRIEGAKIRINNTGKVIKFDKVVSTIPLKSLSECFENDRYSEIKDKCSKLNYRDMLVVYLVLQKDYFSDAHWIYLLDNEFVFNRLSEQKNLNEFSCPPGSTVLSLELSCNKNDYMWNSSDAYLISMAMQDLDKMGVHPRSIVDAFVLKSENVYPIYDQGFENNVKESIARLSQIENLFSIGRQGLFLNNDMHDSMEMGYMAANCIKDKLNSSEWYKIANKYVSEKLEGTKK